MITGRSLAISRTASWARPRRSSVSTVEIGFREIAGIVEEIDQRFQPPAEELDTERGAGVRLLTGGPFDVRDIARICSVITAQTT